MKKLPFTIIRNEEPQKDNEQNHEVLILTEETYDYFYSMLQKVSLVPYRQSDMVAKMPKQDGKHIRFRYWMEGDTVLLEFHQPVILKGLEQPARIFRVGKGSLTRSVLLTRNGAAQY